MTNEERKAMLLEAADCGRPLYDDERPELRKLLRSRSLSRTERKQLEAAFGEVQCGRTSTLRGVAATLAVLLVTVVCASYWIYRHNKHVTQVESIQSNISFDAAYRARYARWQEDTTPTIDAWNHAVRAVDQMSVESIADLPVAEDRYRHVQLEKSRVDKSAAQYEQVYKDLLRDRHQTIDRATKGDIENFWRQSDRLKGCA